MHNPEADNNSIEFSILLTDDECFFIIELCADALDLGLALKLNAICLHQPSDRCTLSLSHAEIVSLIRTLLNKARYACHDVAVWAEDIARCLLKGSNRWVMVD